MMNETCPECELDPIWRAVYPICSRSRALFLYFFSYFWVLLRSWVCATIESTNGISLVARYPPSQVSHKHPLVDERFPACSILHHVAYIRE